MHEVSIIRQCGDNRQSNKVLALIDPLCDTVDMDIRVASLRGLRGLGPQRQQLPKGPPYFGSNESYDQSPPTSHFSRRHKVKESERQIAEMNISHDGEYAIAVCIAFDPPRSNQPVRRILDDGKQSPIHEPQWGDEGWFDCDEVIDDED